MIRLVAKKNRQAGMASIMITMITMIVVSLIVLGFAAISRREQGNTLDQQLSTQAFYAAESGVEDARNVIKQDVGTPNGVPPKTSCTGDDYSKAYTANYPTGNATILDGADNVSYSCLLVDPTEKSLVYDGVGDQSKVIPISASQNINQLKVTWTPTNKPGGTPAQCPGSITHTLATATKWKCGYGLMSLDLVSTKPVGGFITRGGLEGNELTAFFEPLSSAGGGSLSYSGNNGKANVVAAQCGTGSYTQCTATITGLATLNSPDFGLRINSLYQPSNVTITATGVGGPVTFTGTQVTVDVTGKANGVLRRIQVRIPAVESSNLIPDEGIETNGALCKRFEVTPGYFHIPSDIVNPDPSNAMCQPVTSGTPSSGG